MTEVVHLNDDQWQMVQRLEATGKQFTDNPRLRANPEAIEAARRLMDQAYEMKVPEVAIENVRIYVNMYDIEMDLPEHLRDPSRLSSTD